MSSARAPELSQIVLGNFRLLRVLGQGSFATAYLAEQVGTDRKAVVKIAHAQLIHSAQGAMVRERFSSEVRAATRVTHPNLVTIYTAGETTEGLPALAMEYLEGETLGQLLGRGERLSIHDLILAFGQLASALQRVHASRIIHRDVSPENVFLTRGHDGLAVKLLDFGVARLQDRPPSGKFTLGTPFYMALEQIEGEATAASDMYSVGALLWWSLTGQELFSHIRDFPALIEHLRGQRAVPNALELCPTLPPRAAKLLGSMLDHQPARRPTMAGFLGEWAAIEPELRRWGGAQERRQVAVLMAPGALASLVVGMLQKDGHAVLRHEARISPLLAHARLDAVVLDAGLTEPDSHSLASHIAQVLPHVPLCVVSDRPFAPAWSAVPLRLLALLPEELPRLRAAIEDGATSSERAPVSGEYSHHALGEIPELLALIEETLVEGDSQGAIHHCERLERVAHLASLRETGNLARTMRVLMEEHAVDDPRSFLAELERSFLDSFPALLAARSQ